MRRRPLPVLVGARVGRGVCSGVGFRVGPGVDGDALGRALGAALGAAVLGDALGRNVGSARRLHTASKSAVAMSANEVNWVALLEVAVVMFVSRAIATARFSAAVMFLSRASDTHSCRSRHTSRRASFSAAYAAPQCGVHARVTRTPPGATTPSICAASTCFCFFTYI